jgi:hypothetical protein
MIGFLKHRPTLSSAIGVIALAVLSWIVASNLKADTIELRSGERIDGTFKQATSAGVVIDVAGQAITIPIEKVKTIYFGAPPSQPASPAPSKEAVDALRELRSVTGSGIAYRDYSQRVLDARVKVDRYLSAPGNDAPELRTAINVAMLEYELASQGWLTSFSPVEHTNLWTPMGKIMEEPNVAKCPAVQAVLYVRDHPQAANSTSNRKSRSAPSPAHQQDPTEQLGLLFAIKGGAPGSVWSCASAEVAEAERLAAQH